MKICLLAPANSIHTRKIAYITAQTPWGKGETFIMEEMLALQYRRVDLLIIPRNPPKAVFHQEAQQLLASAVWLPLINLRMVGVFFKALLVKASLWKILGHIVRYARNPWVLIKNLAVLPKAVFIAEMLRTENICHIHAHWGSTTSTMAYIISQLTGIPWSFTLHRWDIRENNMLEEKVRSAEFVRCISEHGKKELLKIVGEEYKEKIRVVHLGVKVPENTAEFPKVKKLFIIVTPANLLEVKGHKYLIEACSILIEEGINNFQCILYGEGPLRTELENLIEGKKLDDYIKIPGAIPHEKLIKMYQNHDVDLVVLPSINTDKGEHEGIPVALMEAMAHGIPVISTNTGAIPELISNGAGIIVEEKSPKQLARAIIKTMKEEGVVKGLSETGYQKIQAKFNIAENVETLSGLIQGLIL